MNRAKEGTHLCLGSFSCQKPSALFLFSLLSICISFFLVIYLHFFFPCYLSAFLFSLLSICKKDQNIYTSRFILLLSIRYPAVLAIIDTSSSNLELSIGFLTICRTPQTGATSSFLYSL